MKLRVRVDDMAELYGPACIGSNRDDPYIVKEFLVNVVLPEGCNVASVSVPVAWDESIDLNVPERWDPWQLGRFDPFAANYKVAFGYDTCSWKGWVMQLKAPVTLMVLCPSVAEQKNVEQPADVTCDEVPVVLEHLTDEDLDDDQGPPLGQYWCHSAMVVHEMQHYCDWVNCFKPRPDAARAFVEGIQEPIQCDRPWSTSCGWAYSQHEPEIVQKFYEAYSDAMNDMDNPATLLVECEVAGWEAHAGYLGPILSALPGTCIQD